jgi:hypothetical protein
MPEISHQQAEALRALEWLFSLQARREGRTTVLALAYLRHAFDRQPREWVRVVDHTHTSPDIHALGIIVQSIDQIAVEAGLNIEIDAQRGRFRILGVFAGNSLASAHHFIFDAYTETGLQLPAEQPVERHDNYIPLFSGQSREDQVARPAAWLPDPPQERTTVDRQTLRSILILHVKNHPGLTATQIARMLGHRPDIVSSSLLKEVKAGTLERREELGQAGVRGKGFGRTAWRYYPLVVVAGPVGPSVWERLRTNPFADTKG